MRPPVALATPSACSAGGLGTPQDVIRPHPQHHQCLLPRTPMMLPCDPVAPGSRGPTPQAVQHKCKGAPCDASPHVAARAPAQAQWWAGCCLEAWQGPAAPQLAGLPPQPRAAGSLSPHHLLCAHAGILHLAPPGTPSAQISIIFFAALPGFTQSPRSGGPLEGPSLTATLGVHQHEVPGEESPVGRARTQAQGAAAAETPAHSPPWELPRASRDKARPGLGEGWEGSRSGPRLPCPPFKC